ncbi:MAG: glycosyltransferase, partial [Candidatus Rokuibacteriota bacterium]
MSAGASELAACTVVARRELARARVLAESFRAHHPGASVFVLLVDRIDGPAPSTREPFELIELDRLGLTDAPALCFAYALPELRAVLQPRLLRHLIMDRGVARLVYLAPGSLVLRELDEVRRLLDRHSPLLFPELSAAAPDDAGRRREEEALGAGLYRADLIALRGDPAALSFLDWWARRVRRVRGDGPEASRVAQPWLGLAPALADTAHVVRSLGYAGSSRRLGARAVAVRGDEAWVEDRPLYVACPEDRDAESPDPERVLGPVLARYRARLAAAGDAEAAGWPYPFERFDNGVPIPLEVRRCYRALGSGAARFGDPFVTAAPGSFWDWAREEAHPGSGVSRFWYHVHVTRPDLRRAFPAVFGADRKAFLAWARRHGWDEYRVPAPFEPAARTAAPRATPPAVAIPGPRPGVNLIGYAMSEKGLGEALRATARALDTTGLPYCVVDFPDAGSANADRSLVGVLADNPYPVNVIHLTPDQLPYLIRVRGSAFLRGKYNVGYWMWELPELPPALHGSFAYLDEVWVGSAWCLETIARVSPVPVVKIPLALPLDGVTGASGGRGAFGLPEGAFLVLFMFDAHSTLARKNPTGVIQAFRRAFKDAEDVGLVLKLGRGTPRIRRTLQDEAGEARVIVIDRVLERTEVNALIEASDCYVSLHRSEGFGLTMAEAMALGKPVIATGYSANTDFMTPANSLLVRYDLVALREDHPPYPRGGTWAEPDLDHAAELLRWVYENREAARRLGERAARDIRAYLAAPAVGRLIARRLEVIGRRMEAGDFARWSAAARWRD